MKLADGHISRSYSWVLTASFELDGSMLPSLLYFLWKNPSLFCTASGDAVAKIHPSFL